MTKERFFYFATMKFSDYNISDEIKAQLKVLGFNKPTDIQYKAIKHILNGEDVMAIAQTGTGKRLLSPFRRLIFFKKKENTLKKE